MLISLLQQSEYISHMGYTPTEDEAKFNYYSPLGGYDINTETVHTTFFRGNRLYDEHGVYEMLLDKYEVKFIQNITNPVTGQVVVRNNGAGGALQYEYVYAVAGEKYIQLPYDYADQSEIDTGLGQTAWTKRYAYIGDIDPADNSWSATIDQETHIIYKGVNGKFHYRLESSRFAKPYVLDKEIKLIYKLNNEGEDTPISIINDSYPDSFWMPSAIIINFDGGSNTYKIYVRTLNEIAPVYITSAGTQYKRLRTLAEQTDWGWRYYKPLNIYAPFDDKHYTKLAGTSTVRYLVSGIEFDTIAFSNIIASSILVEVNGQAPITVNVDNTLPEVDDILIPDTVVVYLTSKITDIIQITIEPNAGVVELGNINFGAKIKAGFSNLTFTNKFIDYSPREKDKWGNIYRVDGVKTNFYSGTVDIEIENYDKINRLMRFIGGRTVILNGSDSISNAPADGKGVFYSTMVVGRIDNFSLKTKVTNKKLANLATYSFSIEENV